MQAITVGTTPILLAGPGNRDFLGIFNLDSQSIFICFDGDDGVSTPNTVTTLTTLYSNGDTIETLPVTSATGIVVGQSVSGIGIPANAGIVVTGVNYATNVVSVTQFQATLGGSGNYTFGTVALTTSNGFPIPANTNLVLSNTDMRNLFNKAVYAISAAGTATGAVRIQGA